MLTQYRAHTPIELVQHLVVRSGHQCCVEFGIGTRFERFFGQRTLRRYASRGTSDADLARPDGGQEPDVGDCEVSSGPDTVRTACRVGVRRPLFRRDCDVISSTTKIRQASFHHTVDSTATFLQFFDELHERKAIP